MEVLGFLAGLIFLILPIVTFVKVLNTLNRVTSMQGDIQDIRSQLNALAKQSANPPKTEEVQTKPAVAPAEPERKVETPEPVTIVQPVKPEEGLTPPPVPTPVKADPQPETPVQWDPFTSASAEADEPNLVETIFARIGDWFLVRGRFAPEGMAWEYAMATRWLLRLGIGTVLGGMIFFLKWSIDHGLLAPAGRVGLTLLAAVALIIAGMRMLFKKYHLLAQGMCGLGFCLLYFGFFAAYSLYHLISGPAAFFFWCCVSAGAGIFAVRYRSYAIACLGLLGGYLAPVLLASHSGNAWGFYSYLLLLTVAWLTVARIRSWPSLNIFAMLLSYVLAFAYAEKVHTAAFLVPGMIFFSLAHLLFLAAALLAVRSAQQAGKPFYRHYIPLGINAVVFALWSLWKVRAIIGMEWTGTIFLTVVACYVVISQIGLRKGAFDMNGVRILISIALGFLAVVPVLLFNATWHTFTWCVLAVILARLGKEPSFSILRAWAMLFLCIAGLHTLGYNCYELYYAAPLRASASSVPAFLGAALLRVVKIGILPATLLLVARDMETPPSRHILRSLAFLGCFAATTVETHLFATRFISDFVNGMITIVWTLFAIGLVAVGIAKDAKFPRRGGLVLFAIVVAKLFLFDLKGVATIYRVIASLLIGILLVGGSILYLRNQAKFKTEA